MRCYAGQGKLHESEFYMESLLAEYGYVKEHENVYYTKLLQQTNTSDVAEIKFIYEDDGKRISFKRGSKRIGGCALNFLPHDAICFLKWVYIDEKYSHQGLGTKCMHKLFHELKHKGVVRLDTDTPDSNVRAQGYYLKTGFADMGRMRSYFTVE